MLKAITKSAIFSSFALALFAITNKVALAQSKCTVNGREVDCVELSNQAKNFLGWGIGGLIVLAVFVIWATVFWIMMIVHAANHNVENKAMWIILMAFSGIIGALIYYFVVKRKFSTQLSSNDPIMPR